jgi:hypothetical protein
MDLQDHFANVLQQTGGLPPSAFSLPHVEPHSILRDMHDPPPLQSLNENLDLKYADNPAIDFNPTTMDNLEPFLVDECSLPAQNSVLPISSAYGAFGGQLTNSLTLSYHGIPRQLVTSGMDLVNPEYIKTKDVTVPNNKLSEDCHNRRNELDNHSKKGGRLRILDETKTILEDFFRKEAYPDKNDMSSLAKKTNLKIQQVKTWFTNTRTRRLKKSTVPLPLISIFRSTDQD